MSPKALSPLYRQIARVSRRLFLQTLLDALAWCWVGAILGATVWFLTEPFVPGDRPEWVRWAVAGGLGGLATILALVLALVRAPSRLAAALLLDERFGLKERATTSLTLAPEHLPLPAAQALIADVLERVNGLDVRTRFPVALRWNALLVPLVGLLLAVVALFYDPARTLAKTTIDDPLAQAPPNKTEIEQKVKELEKKQREKQETARANGEKLDPLDADLDKILHRPRDTQADVRNRIKDLTELENKMQNNQDTRAERAQAIKDQLRQMNQMAGMDKNGPAKELQKAIEKGDLNKAHEEIERLTKKLKNNEFTEEEKKDLSNQIKNLKDQMKALSDPKQQEDKLKELQRQGKMSQEDLEKAIEKVRDNAKKMSKDDQDKMQEAADALEECEQCMRKGDAAKAADALKKAGQCMRKMDGLDDMREMDEQLRRLQGCKNCMGDPQPIPGAGDRPEGDPHETGAFNSRARGDFDPKGQKELTGYAPGNSYYKKKSSVEIAGEIKEASQEAPEALERQRIPRAAADMAKGYYENLRKLGEADKDK